LPGSLTVVELCDRLFDDASMFPPGSRSVKEASTAYVRHRWAWYAGMVGSLTCQAGRLQALDRLGEALGTDRLEVSMVVPEGVPSVAAALAEVRGVRHLEIRSVEVPLRAHSLAKALASLSPLVNERRAVLLEVDAATLTEPTVHQLASSGVRLKLRLGATTIDSFQREHDLAHVMVLCAAERLAFKCAAGLHQAVRHRDPDTFLDHHGYLNIALAARIAGSTGSVKATHAVLADGNPRSIAYQVTDLDMADVRAIRAVLSSVGTFSVPDAVTDLVGLGLVGTP
jgi:hypothetical protein